MTVTRSATAAGIERREQLVEVASDLFSRRGYHATSVRDIAAAVGIAPGSVYAHVSAKEELLYWAVRDAADRFLAGLEAARVEEAPPTARFRLAMGAHVRVIADNVERARVFHHEWQALTGRRRAEIRRLRDRYDRLWEKIIRDLPGAADARLARLLVLSAANWIYTWYRPRGGLSPDELADRFSDLLLSGLAPGGRRRSGTIMGGRRGKAG